MNDSCDVTAALARRLPSLQSITSSAGISGARESVLPSIFAVFGSRREATGLYVRSEEQPA